ncbi:MAG: class I SAM-dependent methyltransferase, partial [Myxococcota bacterium]|nr:class I SAM-dependent methyltransferase [Myxococcota bacterium]
MTSDDPIRRNRAGWDGASEAYQRAHGATLARTARAWGVWRIPERELGILGEVRGRDVLELGCGAAAWTRALADDGARAVGVDLSRRQLAHAQAGGLRLVQGDAERLPFRDAAFDVVFCDHGATSFARPQRAVAEASRVLRSGGLLAFCMATP